MSQDPYPSERPDPGEDGPYSSDPYVPNRPDRSPYGPPAGGPPPPGGPPPVGGPAPTGQAPGYGPMPGQGQVPGPGQAPGPGYPHVPPPYLYPPAPPMDASTVILTVVSGVLTFTGLCCYTSIIPLVFGILGMTKQASDPEQAARMTKYGWISLAIITVVVVLLVGGFIALSIWAEST